MASSERQDLNGTTTDSFEYPYWYHWEDTPLEMDDYNSEFGEGLNGKGNVISKFCRQAARYYVAIVIGFGLLGNAGCLICYRRSEELKRYRSTGYLMALASSDLTFLLSLLFVWLKSVGINWHDVQVVCQTSVYASNASIFLSAWYVMALTGEMAFALRRPYSAYAAAADAGKTVLTRIFIVTILGLAVNSWTLALTKTGMTTVYVDEVSPAQLDHRQDSTPPSAFEYEDGSARFELESNPDSNSGSGFPYGSALDMEEFVMNGSYTSQPFSYDAGCHISSSNQMLHITFVLFDLAVTYSIPFAVTLLLNCYIGYKLVQAGRQRRHMSQRRLFDGTRATTTAVVCRMSQNGRRSSVQSTCPRDSLNRKRRLGQQLDRCPFTAMELSRLNSVRSTWKSVGHGPSIRNKEAAVSSLLIAKSIAYLIFNTPSVVHRIWSMWKRQAAGAAKTEAEAAGDHPASDANENWIQLIIYVLFFTQFSVNFLLYSWHAYARRRCGSSSAKAILKSYHSRAPCF